MVKEVVEVKAGYEEIYEKLVEKKARIEEEIRERVKSECAVIDEMLACISEVKEVEVPEEEHVAEAEPEFVEERF